MQSPPRSRTTRSMFIGSASTLSDRTCGDLKPHGTIADRDQDSRIDRVLGDGQGPSRGLHRLDARLHDAKPIRPLTPTTPGVEPSPSTLSQLQSTVRLVLVQAVSGQSTRTGSFSFVGFAKGTDCFRSERRSPGSFRRVPAASFRPFFRHRTAERTPDESGPGSSLWLWNHWMFLVRRVWHAA